MKDYDDYLKGMWIDRIKEMNNMYLISFNYNDIINGGLMDFVIEKDSGKIRALYLYKESDNDLYNSFDYADFVNIPKKYINKIF